MIIIGLYKVVFGGGVGMNPSPKTAKTMTLHA